MELARVMIIAGVALAAVGVLLLVAQQVPWLRFGRLPGDIQVQRDNFTLYFPLATMIVLSIVATLIFLLIGWLRR